MNEIPNPVAITGFDVSYGTIRRHPPCTTFASAATFTIANMASSGYYAFQPSSPYTTVGPNAPPDRVPTPWFLSDKLQAYPPDVYTNAPPTIQPLHPYPAHPARFTERTNSRPESPAQNGRAASVWTAPQSPDNPPAVRKIFKTFLQWKAEAQATTIEYQRTGFPSPITWVLFSNHFSPSLPLTHYAGIRRGPCHSPECYHWWCGPQRSMAHRPSVL
jgi:hypothetical protein